MSDPGTTYRTRDEVQRMRSTQDPIRGLQRYIDEWGLASEEELKVGTPRRECPRTPLFPLTDDPFPNFFQKIDKDAKAEVDAAVEEAKKSPEPDMHDFWNDIYYKGTEPPFMRGREREEIHYY